MAGEAKQLELWQAGLGLVAAIAGLFAIGRHRPASSSSEQLATPVGPAGFGEVGGYGAGGGSSSSSPASVAAPRGGEQTPTAGNPEAGNNGPGVGKLVPKYIAPAKPGESEAEYLKRRSETAVPGARARKVNA